MACAATQLSAQSKLSPGARHILASQGSAQARIAPAGMIPAYIHLAPGAGVSALERLGVEVNLHCGSIVTARVPASALAAVAALDAVAYVQTATAVRPMMDVARSAARVDQVQSGAGLPRAYDGTGIVIGVIDSGLDYTHPNFYNADRTQLRIKRVWEQAYEGGTPPEGFTYGAEFATPEEILAAGGDNMTATHGTHVTGIAAGADTSLGDYHGVAPGADIVLVSLTGEEYANNVNFSDAIAYIFRYADSVGKPCVINMSLGTQNGPHDGTSTFDVVTDAMQGPGRLLVGAIGNFGGTGLHVSKTFGGSRADTLRTFVDFKDLTSYEGGTVDIWGAPGMDLKVNVLTYNTRRGELVDSFSLTVPAAAGSAAPEASKELQGSVGLTSAFGEVSPLNGKPHVWLSSAVSSLRSGYELGFEVISSAAGTVHAWADGNHTGLASNGLDGWAEGDDKCSPAEIGGTGHNVISVGAYVTRSTFDTENSGPMTLEETDGDLASFSVSGPTADNRMKPDVVAPGCATASSLSSNYASISSLPIAGYYEWNSTNYYYGFMNGTSMSAPFVTGVLATWLEANPRLAPADVRAILRETSVTDSFTGDIAGTGSNSWGYGKIDAWAGLVKAIDLATAIGGVQSSPAAGLSVVPSGAGSVRVEAVRPSGAVAVSVLGVGGTLFMRRSLDAASAASGAEIDLSGLAPGVYVVRAASDTQSATAKITVR